MRKSYTDKEIAGWWKAIDGAAKKAPTMQDNENKRCRRCKRGKYQERSIHDDIDGTRTCDNCYHSVPHFEIVKGK